MYQSCALFLWLLCFLGNEEYVIAQSHRYQSPDTLWTTIEKGINQADTGYFSVSHILHADTKSFVIVGTYPYSINALKKIDESGNILWSNTFGDADYRVLFYNAYIEANAIILTGIKRSSILSLEGYFLQVRFDLYTGSLIDTITSNDSYIQYGPFSHNSFTRLDDNSFLIGGEINSGTKDEIGSAFLTRIDPKGKTIYTRMYSKGNAQTLTTNSIVSYDKNTYILGINREYNAPDSQLQVRQDIVIKAVDSNGTEIWTTFIPNFSLFLYAREIIKTNSNNMILRVTVSNSYEQESYTKLYSVDALTGNYTELSTIRFNEYTSINQMIECKNGDILLCGSTGNFLSQNVLSYASLQMLLVHCNQFGSIVKSYEWGSESKNDGLSRILEDSAHKYFLAGSVNRDTLLPFYGAMQYYSLVNLTKNNIFSREDRYTNLQLYPNPSIDEMNLYIHPTELVQSVQYFNPLGQQFYPKYQLLGNLLTTDTRTLPGGMYLVRITYQDHSLQEVRKFLKVKKGLK